MLENLASLTNGQSLESLLQAGARPAGPAGPEFDARQAGVLQQLQEQAAQPVIRPRDVELTEGQRDNQWMNFGLQLMQAGADPKNNFFSALGEAGRGTLADVAALKQQEAGYEGAERNAQRGALETTLDQMQGNRDYAAERMDANRDYRLDVAGMEHDARELEALDRHRRAQEQAARSRNASMDSYRSGKLALDREESQRREGLDAARARYYDARADKAGAEAAGGVDGFMSSDESREYNAYLKQFETRNSNGVPILDDSKGQPLNVYEWRRRRDQLNGAPGEPSGALQELRSRYGGERAPSGAPVPLRPDNDYSSLW